VQRPALIACACLFAALPVRAQPERLSSQIQVPLACRAAAPRTPIAGHVQLYCLEADDDLVLAESSGSGKLLRLGFEAITAAEIAANAIGASELDEAAVAAGLAGAITLVGDIDGLLNANQLDLAAVESGLEGVLDAQDLQGAWIRRTVAADITTSSDTVYSAVTDLDWTASASTNYQFRCVLFISTAEATTGLQLQWLGPSAPTEVSISRTYHTAAIAATILNTNAFHSAATDDGAPSHSGSKGADTVEGILLNAGNSGTVALSIISGVNLSSVTLEAGSYCERTTF